MKYLYYSLVFIPITLTIKYFVPNIMVACVIEVAVCGLVYLGILIFTKDAVFFELADKLLIKFKLKK